MDKTIYCLLLCHKHAYTENLHTDTVHLKFFESQQRLLISVNTERIDQVF